MQRRKISKIILVVFAVLSSFWTSDVYALVNAKKGDCNFKAKASYDAADHNGVVTIGGRNYPASCEDAGLSALTGKVNCQQIDSSKAGLSPREQANKILQEQGIGPKTELYQLAMRLLELKGGTTKPTNKNKILNQFANALTKDKQAEIMKTHPEVFGNLSLEGARKAVETVNQAWKNYTRNMEHYRGTSSNNLIEGNDYVIKPLIATFDEAYNTELQPIANKSIVVECSVGGGNSNSQRYIFSLAKCPEEEEEEEEEECVNGLWPDGTPCEEEPPVEAEECGSMSPSKSGDMHNCCVESTRDEMRENELAELFCESARLGVKFYQAKGGADYYLDPYANDSLAQLGSEAAGKCGGGADSIENYCATYCTQRSVVTQPGSIVATNGRYFKLKDTNAKGTTSAYVESFKRCRTIIDYDKWYLQYMTYVKEEIRSYNEHQDYSTRKELYDEMFDRAPGDLGFYKQSQGTHCAYTVGEGENAKTFYRNQMFSNEPDYPNGEIKRTFHFPKTLSTKEFEPVRLVPLKYEKAGMYTAVNLEGNDEYSADPWCGAHVRNGTKYKYRHEPDTIYPEDWDLLDEAHTRAEQKPYPSCDGCDGCSEAGIHSPPEYGYCHKEYSDILRDEEIPETLKNDKSAFEASTKNACNLEGIIAACDGYFTDENISFSNGSLSNGDKAFNAEDAFVLNTDMNFSYVQTYVDESMRCVTDQQYVTFNPPGGGKVCQVSGPEPGPNGEDHLIGKSDYSENEYFAGKENLWDFSKNVKLEPGLVFPSYKGQLDNPYDADKVFNSDARYRGECWKEEGEFETKTTIPDGYTIVPNKNTTARFTRNITIHKKQYYVYVTTVTGQFETFWEINGVGENAVFDEFIMGEHTCSGHTANGGNLPGDMSCNATEHGVSLNGPVYTCSLRVVSQVIETGKCNDPYVPNCEYSEPQIKSEGFNYFNFKIVDPKNIFPNCRFYDGGKCNYAWNWLMDGVDTRNQIEWDAEEGLTYAPSKLTYSIKLTTKDIETIREYNKAIGTYDDFNLTCEGCPQDYSCNETISSPNRENTCKESTSCHSCRSDFMSQLYSGYLTYGGKTVNVTVPKGNLSTIRSKNNWQK